MPNRWERKHGLNPERANPGGDPDRDRLDNILEYVFQGDPRDRDTDGDGLRDGTEVTTWHTAVDVRDQAVGRLVGRGLCATGSTESPCPDRPLLGMPVVLKAEDDEEVSRSYTHANGTYAFRAPPGTYRVEHLVPWMHLQAPGPPRFIEVTRKQSRPDRNDFYLSSTVRSGVIGQATQSPTCPAQRIGEDCVAPLEGARIRVEDPEGRTVAETVTERTGLYSFALEPGSYSLVAEPLDGAFPTPPAPVDFVVAAEDTGPSWIPADYDTGIR